jgi:hypothetical protein
MYLYSRLTVTKSLTMYKMNHFPGLTLTLNPKETTEIDYPGLRWEQNQ